MVFEEGKGMINSWELNSRPQLLTYVILWKAAPYRGRIFASYLAAYSICESKRGKTGSKPVGYLFEYR